jgi:hypothetical protein
MSALRLPGYGFQREEAHVVLHESHRTQEAHSGTHFPSVEMRGVPDAMVADSSLYDPE